MPRPAPRTCLLAWGSRGDVQPFVALALGMQRAGMDVAVAATDDFEQSIRSAGLAFEPLGISMRDLMADPTVLRWLTGSSHSLRAELRHMSDVVRIFREPAVTALVRLVGDYDAFVSGILTGDALGSVAHQLAKPHVLGMLAPASPTRVAAAQLFPVLRRDSVVNLAAGIVGGHGSLALGSAIRHGVEQRLGLRRRSLHQQSNLLRRTTTLLGASPRVVPQAADWGARTLVTGYWTLPADPGWQPRADLEDFLRHGPVHIGLGSMPVTDPGRWFAVVEETLDRLDLTATVQGSWDTAPPTSDRIRVVGDVPHEWLLPRVRAVVHHGGAGTTGAALRAGVPQVLVTHMGDQPYWGRRVNNLGCGPAPLPLHRLDAAALAERLGTALERRYVDRAEAFGRRVRDEDGVATAVERLQRVLGR